MHYTPGGPLRFSLEGHQFAVFGFRLTSDMRHLVSISNKIITFDLTTGDTSRTVYPSMVGLMLELDMCPNNKYVGAITFSSMILPVSAGTFSPSPTTIRQSCWIPSLDNSKYWQIPSPPKQSRYKQLTHNFGKSYNYLQGICMLETQFVVYSPTAWKMFNLDCKEIDAGSHVDVQLFVLK